MTVLAPIEGDGASVERLADALRASAERFGALAHVLAGIREGSTWDSPSGAAFASLADEVPPVLDAAARRYAAAAAALVEFTAALASAQRVATTAVHEASLAQQRYTAAEREAEALAEGGATPESPQLVSIRQLQLIFLQQGRDAEAAHARAHADFRAADERCAARLRAACDDEIADPWGYRVLHTVKDIADSVAALGVFARWVPVLAPLSFVAAGVGLVADGSLLLVYDEGDWKEVGTNAALTATGFAGGSLTRGAVHGASESAGVVRASRPMTVRSRSAVGAREEARARVREARTTLSSWQRTAAPAKVPNAARPPLALRQLPGHLGQRVRETARERLESRLRGPWRLVSANGASAQRMFVAGITLEAGSTYVPKAVDKVERARELLEARERRKSGEEVVAGDLSLGACPQPTPSTPRG